MIQAEPTKLEAAEVAATIHAGGQREAPASGEHEGLRLNEATEPNEAESMLPDLPNGESGEPPAIGSAKARLGAGRLRELVLVHLREHPDLDYTPSALGKVLAHSSGAIANACEKLGKEGSITLTSDRPRKYRIVDRV